MKNSVVMVVSPRIGLCQSGVYNERRSDRNANNDWRTACKMDYYLTLPMGNQREAKG